MEIEMDFSLTTFARLLQKMWLSHNFSEAHILISTIFNFGFVEYYYFLQFHQ